MFSLFLVTHLPHIVHTFGHVLLIEVDLGISKLEFHDFVNIAWIDFSTLALRLVNLSLISHEHVDVLWERAAVLRCWTGSS